MHEPHPMLATAYRHRFVALLIMLMLLVVAAPFLESAERSLLAEAVTFALFTAMMLSAIYAVTGSRRVLGVAITLAVPTVVIWGIGLTVHERWLAITQYSFSTAFVLYSATIILRFLFRTERATANTVAASLCVYMLIAVAFSQVYGIVENFHVDSFEMSGQPGDGQVLFGPERPAAALYFSLTTMSTLGYGDIVPRTPPARVLASMQAVAGQMYLAVLVARFVGLHIAHTRRPEPE